MRRQKVFHLLILVVSALMGAAVWFVCEGLYDALVDSLARPVLMGLLFGLLALAAAGGVFAVSLLRGTFEQDVVTGGSALAAGGILMGLVLLVAVLAALFQWLYSLRLSGEAAKPTSYIFLLDDSGSMLDNDPHQRRFSAIGQVLEGQEEEIPYMVYGFAENVSLLREMGPLQAGEDPGVLTGNSDGGTAMGTVLAQVLADYEAGLWDGGASPKVILLSDGIPTDFQSFSDISELLKEYVQQGVSISTVGLDGVDGEMMERIASRTGGVFVDIQDAARLGEAMLSAASRYAEEDLVTARYTGGILPGVLRVLFLTLLGLGIGLAAAVAYGQTESLNLILSTSAAKALAGALLLELCTARLGNRVFWWLLWVLAAATVCTRTASPIPVRRTRPVQRRRGRSRSNRMLGRS